MNYHRSFFRELPLIRLAKALLTLATGVTGLLIVFGNLTDYQTNFKFVQHVLSMDTTFPDNTIKYRAIKSSRIHHAIYHFIILVEAVMAILCTLGGVNLLRHLKADKDTFHRAKRPALGGLLAGLLLWFFGFQGVAGEWFGMWMSRQWNGLPDAARLTQFMAIILTFVSLKNDD
ncbi:MAG: DUF2165 family protein [Anaerolineae bacterium]|nr:DUF2165 family protein [Anaerolineae bacterium]